MKWILRIILLSLAALAFTCFLHPSRVEAQGDDEAVIKGTVITEYNGYGVSQIRVILIDPDNLEDRFTAAVTDLSGQYTATQTISKTWIVRFEADPTLTFPALLPEYYDDSYTVEEATLITAEVGTVTENINASLATLGQIGGRVTDEENGDPIANVRVSAYASNEFSERRNAFTDVRGIYTITTYGPASHKISFDPPDGTDFAREFYPDKKTWQDATIITVPDDRPLQLDVTLGPGAVITGQIRSSWFNKPIESPLVYVLDEDGDLVQSGGRSNEILPFSSPPVQPPGFYALYNVPEGSYQLRWEAMRHATVVMPDVNVEAGAKLTEINATLHFTPQVVSIATSAALPGVIALTFDDEPIPVLTLNGGQSWQYITPTTWVSDESVFAYPDRYQLAGIFAAVTPRGEAEDGARLTIAADDYAPSISGIRTGIYRSGDNGQSWADSQVDPPVNLDECFEVRYQTPFVSPLTPTILYMLYTCWGNGSSRLLVSDNSGVTWRDVTTVDSRDLVLYANSTIVPSTFVANELYAFDGSSQWYQSLDNGQNWQEKEYPVMSFVFDATDPQRLYGWRNEYYVITGVRSQDGGSTWETWPDPGCPFNYGIKPQLIAHPFNSQMLFMRCANGLTDGIFRSDNSGDGWRKMDRRPGQILTFDSGVPGRLLWARDDGLWASTDNAESWQVLLPDYSNLVKSTYLPSLSVEQ